MIEIDHKKNNKTVTVIVSFIPSDVIEKEGLEKKVIENHILMEAVGLLSKAASNVLLEIDNQKIDEEVAAEKIKLDEEAIKKKEATDITSNVIPNSK